MLLVTDPGNGANPFGAYLGEILKTEGFIAHERAELARVDPAYLRRFRLVILAQARLSRAQREAFGEFVADGGRLLALRPDPELADLFGLAYRGTRPEGLHSYLAVDSEADIGRGIDTAPLQYHGPADEYEVRGASVVAWLCDDEATRSPHPAVALNRHGDGLAVAFTYDLARSVVLTRQGNPDWVCDPEAPEDGDGTEGIRPVDCFVRQSGETWADPAKLPIPQADEQQRLLGNCLMALSEGALPLPRLWYLPAGKRAVLVMTGDGDDVGFDHFDRVISAVEEYGGHYSAYLQGLEGDPTRAQVDDWIARGHEVSLHVVDVAGWVWPTFHTLASAYADAAGRFAALYGRAPGPSSRNHRVTWYGWVDGAEIALRHGIRVDFNYYHGRQWTLPDGSWANGYFTGSGLPQRFVKADGAVLDVFQVLTQWTDESQLYRQLLGTEGATRLVREMFGLAERSYPSVFVANFHPGGWQKRQTEPWARNMMQEAVRRGIPIWSGEELCRFLDARDGASLHDVAWDGTHLRFDFAAPPSPAPLTVMVPASFGELRLLAVVRDGVPAAFSSETFAGRDYAFLDAVAGDNCFVATYSATTT
ncbi:MAG: hypothetical protein ACYC4L_16705 [Chloroflexota bacterium]